MTLVVTDAVDPGPAHVAQGINPGYGRGNPVPGSTNLLKTLKSKIITLTYSATYATGGDTLSTAQLGGLAALFVKGMNTGGLRIVPTYVGDGTVTLKLFWKAANAAVFGEVPNTTAIAFTAKLLVIGRDS